MTDPLAFTPDDLKVLKLAVDGMHRVIAVPPDQMSFVIVAKRKLDLQLQREMELKANGGDEAPSLTAVPPQEE